MAAKVLKSRNCFLLLIGLMFCLKYNSSVIPSIASSCTFVGLPQNEVFGPF